MFAFNFIRPSFWFCVSADKFEFLISVLLGCFDCMASFLFLMCILHINLFFSSEISVFLATNWFTNRCLSGIIGSMFLSIALCCSKISSIYVHIVFFRAVFCLKIPSISSIDVSLWLGELFAEGNLYWWH